jgi:hypothetical protein
MQKMDKWYVQRRNKQRLGYGIYGKVVAVIRYKEIAGFGVRRFLAVVGIIGIKIEGMPGHHGKREQFRRYGVTVRTRYQIDIIYNENNGKEDAQMPAV